jgi:PIN domain nuclease of toxin-antitoxin system
VSAASAWEISTKARLGKLPGAVDVAADLAGIVTAQVREHMTFHIVGTVDEILDRALEPTALAVAA